MLLGHISPLWDNKRNSIQCCEELLQRCVGATPYLKISRKRSRILGCCGVGGGRHVFSGMRVPGRVSAITAVLK